MKKTKIISFLMALFMLLSCMSLFVACDTDEGGDDTTDGAEVTEAVELEILATAAQTYSIVRPDEISEELLEAVQSFNKAMREIFGDTLQFKSDFYMEGVPAYSMSETEVLIGATNREESIAFLDGIKEDDYGFKLMGKKLVIAGNTDEGTIKALEKFKFDILSKFTANQQFTDSDIFFESANDYLHEGEYLIDSLTIGDVAINEYRIVYPHKAEIGEDNAAELLANKIADTCGAVVKVVSDKVERGEQVHEILIGHTNRTTDADYASAMSGLNATQSAVWVKGEDILFCSEGATALMSAVNAVTEKFPTEAAESFKLELEEKSVYQFDDQLLSAMTFNVQVWGTSEARDDRVREIIAMYSPDTIGFQEVDKSWYNKLIAFLAREYAYVGSGRDGGTSGEANPIFYKRDIFRLIDSGTKWLSDTPDVKSKYSESSLNRIYTYALLERKSDGERIMVINTHFDHESGTARQKQAGALMKFVNSITDYPIVLTGDFNCGTTSAAYGTIVSPDLRNSSDVATKIINKGPTYTNYGSSTSTIDFVFVTPKKLLVESYKVCNDKINGSFPSDHHPVFIEYSIY